MAAFKITAIWNFIRFNLLDEEWSDLNDDLNKISSQPFHIANDGYCLIIKDSTETPGELSEEE